MLVSKFKITNTELCVPVLTLSTQDNVKRRKRRKLESCFKRTINSNEHQSKKTNRAQNRYLDFLIDEGFQGVYRLFVLAFKDKIRQESYKQYYFPTMEIKDDNVLIDGRNVLEQTITNNLRTYNKIQKIATGQGGDYTTGCLLDYPCSTKYYKLIAIVFK